MPRSLPFLSVLWLVVALSAPAFSAQLPYPQRQPFKDATGYLDQVEAYAEDLGRRAAEWKPRLGDAGLPMAEVRQGLATLERAQTYLGYAETRFKNLPLDHPDVAEQFKRVAPLKESLAASGSVINAVAQGLNKLTDASSYPDLRADLTRLQEINSMFGNPQILETQPARAVETVRQISAVKAERDRLLAKYGPLMQQQTAEGRDFQGVMRHFEQQFGAFSQAAQDYAKEAPERISAMTAKVRSMAADAARDRKPGFFSPDGGIASELAQAETRLSVLEALDPAAPAVAASRKAIQEARAFANTAGAGMNDAIIDANRLPNEPYSGPDKDDLIGQLKGKWAREGLKGEVLRVGINSQAWERNTRWEWVGSAWVKRDTSRLQGFVAVKSGDLAVVYHVNFLKNHLEGDRVELFFFDDPSEEPVVQRKVRLKNVR